MSFKLFNCTLEPVKCTFDAFLVHHFGRILVLFSDACVLLEKSKAFFRENTTGSGLIPELLRNFFNYFAS